MPDASFENSSDDLDRTDSSDQSLSNSRRLAWICGALSAGLVLVLVLLIDPPTIVAIVTNAWQWLKAAPAPVYFGVFSIAALTPFPVSALYITAGPIYGVATSLLWVAPALVLNTLLVHAIASGFLRIRLESLLSRYGLRVPRLESRSDQWLFAVLIRITPGFPFFLQSWLLGLSGIELVPFILITLAIQMLYATGFVVLGRSAFEGDVGIAVTAASVLVVISIAARLIHKRFRSRRASLLPETAPDASD